MLLRSKPLEGWVIQDLRIHKDDSEDIVTPFINKTFLFKGSFRSCKFYIYKGDFNNKKDYIGFNIITDKSNFKMDAISKKIEEYSDKYDLVDNNIYINHKQSLFNFFSGPLEKYSIETIEEYANNNLKIIRNIIAQLYRETYSTSK